MEAAIPNFQLQTLAGKWIWNTEHEFKEQKLLHRHLHPDDCVLELGANIGTSSIMIDRLLRPDSGGRNHVCVEPNPDLQDVLEKNRLNSKSKFQIVSAVVTEQTNDMYMCGGGKNMIAGFVSPAAKDANARKVDAVSLHKLGDLVDKPFNVLFADCEGCMCTFTQEYPAFFDQLRLIIMEEDRALHCNYRKIRRFLENKGFATVDKQYFPFVRVWLRQ